MVAVVVLVMVCFTVAMAVGSSSIFGIRQTLDDQSRVQALAAAEAGRDATVARLRAKTCSPTNPRTGSAPDFSTEVYASASETAPTTRAGLTAGCPGDSSRWVVIHSTGWAADGTKKEVEATYPWAVSVQEPVVDGAIIEGGSAPDNISSAQVYHGDVILNTTGTVNCNGSSLFDGDIVLPRGSLSLSNACQINGDVIAYGDITLYNVTIAVGGDVISTHGNVSIEGATVNGSVKAYGGVTLNNGVTIGHDVIAQGHAGSTFTGSSSSMKTIGGSVSVGGGVASLDLMKVTGSVIVAGTGVTKVGAVGAVTAASIRLAGTCSPCTSTPVPQQKVTGLTAPTFADPPQMSSPTWVDYPFIPANWTGAGYQVLAADKVASGDAGCNYQGNSKLIGAVDALTTSAVIDARGCVDTKGASTLNLYGVRFALRANATFIAPGYNAQALVVDSADGKDHNFNLITPDTTNDGAPTCGGSGSTVAAAVMGAHISGVAYTPCTLSWGSTGAGTTQWTGQLIAGFPDFSGSSGIIHYLSIPLPGDHDPGSLSGGGIVSSALVPTRVSQRES